MRAKLKLGQEFGEKNNVNVLEKCEFYSIIVNGKALQFSSFLMNILFIPPRVRNQRPAYAPP